MGNAESFPHLTVQKAMPCLKFFLFWKIEVMCWYSNQNYDRTNRNSFKNGRFERLSFFMHHFYINTWNVFFLITNIHLYVLLRCNFSRCTYFVLLSFCHFWNNWMHFLNEWIVRNKHLHVSPHCFMNALFYITNCYFVNSHLLFNLQHLQDLVKQTTEF